MVTYLLLKDFKIEKKCMIKYGMIEKKEVFFRCFSTLSSKQFPRIF